MSKKIKWTKSEIELLASGSSPAGRSKKAIENMKWKIKHGKVLVGASKVKPMADTFQRIGRADRFAVSTGKTKAEAVFSLIDAKFSTEEVAKFLGIPLKSVIALLKVRDAIPFIRDLVY